MFISTTNLDGGTAHFGQTFSSSSYSSSLPITTRAPLIHTLCTSPIPTTNLHGGTSNTHSLDTPHTIPISTGDTLIHSFGHPYPYYQAPRGHTNTNSLDTPPTSTNLHGGYTNTLFRHPFHRHTYPAMVAIPLSTICLVCLGCRRAWRHPDKIH